MSLAVVSLDRWLGPGGLGPRKTSAAHDAGSSLDGARLGQADMQSTGVLSWGPAEHCPTARWVLTSAQ